MVFGKCVVFGNSTDRNNLQVLEATEIDRFGKRPVNLIEMKSKLLDICGFNHLNMYVLCNFNILSQCLDMIFSFIYHRSPTVKD